MLGFFNFGNFVACTAQYGDTDLVLLIITISSTMSVLEYFFLNLICYRVKESWELFFFPLSPANITSMLKDDFFKKLDVAFQLCVCLCYPWCASWQVQKSGTGSAHSSVILVQVDPWCRPPLNPLSLVRIKMPKESLVVGSWLQGWVFQILLCCENHFQYLESAYSFFHLDTCFPQRWETVSDRNVSTFRPEPLHSPFASQSSTEAFWDM